MHAPLEEGKELENTGQILDGIKLFADVPSADLAVLAKECEWLAFVSNDIILDRDDNSRDVYFLTDGKV